jgi:5-methylcytosine-specific restriction endonuclease McrA
MLPPNFQSELWEEDELEIWRSQGYRCVVCGKWADTIHEIVHKSKTKDWKREGNRVLVCVGCHDKIHHEGGGFWRIRLEVFRDKALRLYK